jgi:hypothetical protein
MLNFGRGEDFIAGIAPAATRARHVFSPALPGRNPQKLLGLTEGDEIIGRGGHAPHPRQSPRARNGSIYSNE